MKMDEDLRRIKAASESFNFIYFSISSTFQYVSSTGQQYIYFSKPPTHVMFIAITDLASEMY